MIVSWEQPRLTLAKREADRFAIQAMQAFYEFDRTHEHIVGDPQLDLIGGSITLGPAIPPQAQVFADLAGTLFVMSVFNLHLNTPYSPFFQDKTSPRPFLIGRKVPLRRCLSVRSSTMT